MIENWVALTMEVLGVLMLGCLIFSLIAISEWKNKTDRRLNRLTQSVSMLTREKGMELQEQDDNENANPAEKHHQPNSMNMVNRRVVGDFMGSCAGIIGMGGLIRAVNKEEANDNDDEQRPDQEFHGRSICEANHIVNLNGVDT